MSFGACTAYYSKNSIAILSKRYDISSKVISQYVTVSMFSSVAISQCESGFFHWRQIIITWTLGVRNTHVCICVSQCVRVCTYPAGVTGSRDVFTWYVCVSQCVWIFVESGHHVWVLEMIHNSNMTEQGKAILTISSQLCTVGQKSI